MKFFLGQRKVQEFCGWTGKFRKDLENQGKVREFENKWLWHQKIYLFYSRGEKMYILISLSPSLSALGATLKGNNLLPLLKGANSFL